MPDLCPKCNKRQYQRLHCSLCRLTALERLMQSNAGKLLTHVYDLDAMLQLPGCSITPSDIDAVEWHALRVLWSERDKYIKEEREQMEAEQRAQQAAAAAAARANR